ncbi:MAG: ParA family protein [Pseudomonadota bacterium]|nr:ParA family protein [Pseudomonadota bacterium]
MHVWAVANQKGGVGKTTSTVSLAGLLTEQGHKVLVVDLDPHGSLTSYFGYDPDALTNSTYQLFQGDDAFRKDDVVALVVDTSVPGLSLLPTSPALATVERQMTGKDGMGLRVGKAMSVIGSEFDYVLLDCPPVLGVLMINALAACERLLVPVQTEFLALKGLERMTRTMQMIQKARPQPLIFTIVPTMFDRRTQASVSSLNVLRKQYADNLWRATIPVDTKLRDASRLGRVPSQHDPDGRAVRAYRQLMNHILAEDKQVEDGKTYAKQASEQLTA